MILTTAESKPQNPCASKPAQNAVPKGLVADADRRYAPSSSLRLSHYNFAKYQSLMCNSYQYPQLEKALAYSYLVRAGAFDVDGGRRKDGLQLMHMGIAGTRELVRMATAENRPNLEGYLRDALQLSRNPESINLRDAP